MSLPRISLQAFDAFERVAQSGSVQTAADEMGLSISSVSAHVSRLEEQFGATLFDRSRRPFVLTREGREALHHLSKGLYHFRRATSASAIGGLLGTQSLCIGIVEDFESSVAPELAVVLANQMPQAKLSVRNILSHEAPGLLRNGVLDVAIASTTRPEIDGLRSDALLCDPFVLAMPRQLDSDPSDLVRGQSDLPFLRFNPAHLLGKQIEAHLTRSRISLAERYSFDSAQSILAVVASGGGWSILTPLGFMRAQRFSDSVQLRTLPLAAFSRTIALTSRAEFNEATARAIGALFRQIVERDALGPFRALYPELSGQFLLLEGTASDDASAGYAPRE